jgi:4-hydroxy-tetrahydrodipicolinate reductase
VTNIIVSGIRGRMGQSLAALVRDQADQLRIVAGCGRERAAGADAERYGCPEIVPFEDAADVVEMADVVIDFSNAEATRSLLEAAGNALHGRALVVGTTGLETDTDRALQALSEKAAVLIAANFSIGVNLLLGLTERVATALRAERYDIEIVEAHHRLKVDAPSGTALALGHAAAAGRSAQLQQLRQDGRSGDTGQRPVGEIGFHAVRGGAVVGEHRVLFLGDRETIELRHEALDRSLFAEGALHAAQWLATRPPGRYFMSDVLGF